MFKRILILSSIVSLGLAVFNLLLQKEIFSQCTIILINSVKLRITENPSGYVHKNSKSFKYYNKSLPIRVGIKKNTGTVIM